MTTKHVLAAKLYIAIGIGGMIGAISRYAVSFIFGQSIEGFPFATLTVNLIGCFLLSFIMNNYNIKKRLAPWLFSAVSVGMIGSFTTFSAVTIEAVELWNTNAYIAIAYIFISLFGGIYFCYIGYKLATRKKGKI